LAIALPVTWVGTGRALVPAGDVADVPLDDVHVVDSSARATSRRREDFTGEPAT
jgi:hypothetical protein